MKKRLPILLIIILCLCFTLVFSSCDAILDLIFGPVDNPDLDPDTQPAHTHTLTAKTYVGQICTGQSSVTYYQCESCGKCFVDDKGAEELADVSTLSAGHLYVIKFDDQNHWRTCKFCKNTDENSAGNHTSAVWRYDTARHYKTCDVCGTDFASEEHTMSQGQCSVCHRHQDYAAVCASDYGYQQLAVLDHGDRMQKLYNKIADAVSAAHSDESLNIEVKQVSENVTRPALSINVGDCYVNANEAYVALASFILDNPLYYWVGKQAGVSFMGGNQESSYIISLNIIVDENSAQGSARAETNAVIYDKIDYYMSYVSGEDNSYDIALALHDEIARNVCYAYEDNGAPADELWAHSIEGLFVRNSAVCEGYAKAFQLLLNACGVNNVYVTGESNGMGHAWNLVDLGDNAWYWYDLTWDDQPNAARGVVHDNLCKTDAEFDDHTVSTKKQGLNYLYDLPDRATENYNTERLEINDVFSDNGCNYRLVGYKSLSLVKCVVVGDDGVLEIPAYITADGKTYNVVQIDRAALITYNYNEQGQIVSLTGPSVKKIVIPHTVEVIYNASIRDCSTLESAVFENAEGWSRYALNGKSPAYEQIDEITISNGASALAMLKQIAPMEGNLSGGYTYVWTKSSGK